MQSTIERWSKEAETRRMMDRVAGDKTTDPQFWPGRPGMWSDENPIAADGVLLDIAHEAQSDAASNDALAAFAFIGFLIVIFVLAGAL